MTCSKSVRWASCGWLLLLSAVILVFLRESVFQGCSLFPTDVLHEFILPVAGNGPDVSVQNHYTIDQVVQLYPGVRFWQESVKAGEVPLWNPYMFGGHPQFATGMWGILCPIRALYLFLSVERGYTLGLVLEFWLVGVFMFAYLRELGRSGCAALVGSVAYAMNSGFLHFYWLTLNVFVWVPLLLWCFERAMRRQSRGYALVAGVVMGVAFVSGSVQMAFYVGFLWSFYALGHLVWTQAGQRRQAFGQVVLVGVVALLVASVQLAPTVEFLLRDASGRVRDPGAVVPGLRHTLLGLPLLITFVFPFLVGTPETFDLSKLAQTSMYAFTGSIGIVPFTLFLIGAKGTGERRVRWFLLLIATVLGIIFCTPLLRFVYHRFFTLAVLGMAVIAAFGVDSLLARSESDQPRVRRVLWGMTALCIAVGLALVVAQWYVQRHGADLEARAQAYVVEKSAQSQFAYYQQWFQARVPAFLAHFRVSNPLFAVPLLALPVMAWACFAYARGRLSRPWLCAILVALTVIELLQTGRLLVPQVNLQAYPLQPPIRLLARVKSDPELCRVARWMPGRTTLLMENVFMSHGIQSTGGYESLFPKNLANLLTRTNGQFTPVLDVQNVKYLFTETSATLPPERFELLGDEHGARLFLNKHCRPRFQFYTRWQVVPDGPAALQALTVPAFDPWQVVLLEQEPGLPSPPPGQNLPGPEGADIQRVEYSNQRVVARVRTPRDGILLLADTWYPGWKARVDRRPAPLLRADGVLRAVALPAGEHEVEFRFEPFLFRVGAVVSLVTLAACALWGLVRWWVRKSKPVASEG